VDVAELDAQITMMQDAGLIADAGQVWWDLRLHHTYPTVEFRVADAVPRVEDVTALASLTQAFVAYLLDAYERGVHFSPVQRWILCENRWRAARFGTEAEFIATSPLPQGPTLVDQLRRPDEGPRSFPPETLKLQSVRSIVAEICDYLTPTAAQLDTTQYLRQCQRIADTGSAADRQLAVAGAGAPDLRQVVRQYCQETLTT
jgi:carboxylate-amine ligase